MNNGIALVIKHYMQLHSVSLSELERVTGISHSTFYRCMKQPTEWRLGNLNRIYTFLNVPREEREFH